MTKRSAVGNRSAETLRDLTHLRMQLHACAASSDSEIRAFVRTESARLIVTVSEPGDFFAQGTLMNLAAALEWTDADVTRQRMGEERGSPRLERVPVCRRPKAGSDD